MIPLHKEVTSIGRKQADIILDDARVSGIHAEVRLINNRFQLVDLDSTNGTYVNRRKISSIWLSDQDVIEIGMTTLCFFEDIRDFHGQVEEAAENMKAKPTPPTQTTNIASLTTTTKTIRQTKVYLKILQGDQAGKTLEFRKSHIIIGRSEVDVLLNDLDVSRSHALIEVLSPKLIYLRDLGSTNGTYLNDERVTASKLNTGDIIKVGNTSIEFTHEKREGDD